VRTKLEWVTRRRESPFKEASVTLYLNELKPEDVNLFNILNALAESTGKNVTAVTKELVLDGASINLDLLTQLNTALIQRGEPTNNLIDVAALRDNHVKIMVRFNQTLSATVKQIELSTLSQLGEF
jgi:hypothetical protein